jgi:DNA-directed RNA polymerase specialized sigma24 family protein
VTSAFQEKKSDKSHQTQERKERKHPQVVNGREERGGFMFRLEQTQAGDLNNRYATGADFCRAFKQNLNQLYMLGFLLTANHRAAERCLLSALEKAPHNKYVFREFVRSWIKRTVINAAIQSVFEKPNGGEHTREPWSKERSETAAGATINAVTSLAALDRFVFVISVLEGCSDKECSLLLRCSVETVATARMQAFSALRFRQAIRQEQSQSDHSMKSWRPSPLQRITRSGVGA